MTKKLLSILLLAGGTLFAQVSIGIGIRIGPPPAPRVVRVRPVAPGPDWVWLDGYWYVQGNKYRWHDGYWTRPPYAGAVWVAPHHDGERWFDGYWQGDHGRFAHDHKWDRDHDRRDWDRDRDRHDRDDHHDRH